VFEVATLVRTVQYIGSAGGNLRARLGTLAASKTKLPPSPGGYYVRYETTAGEDEALAARLAAYRAAHRGLPPMGNREAPSTLRVARRRAA